MKFSPAAAFALFLALPGGQASAQPEPSFRAGCDTLRQSLDALKPGGELLTIAVEGALTMAKTGSGLSYFGLCEAPAPQVLCVTEATDERKVGDRVVVSGTLERIGPNHVKLDPCLAQPPE